MKTVCQELENSEKSNQNSEERGFLTSHTILHGAMQLTQKIHKTFAILIMFSSYFFHKQLEYYDIGGHKKCIIQGFHYSAISAS